MQKLFIRWFGVFSPKVSPKNRPCIPFNNLAVLVRHSQAQKCLQINPNKLLWNFLFSTNWLTNWCLQPSITQEWKELQAWFLHCSMLLCLKICLFTYQPQQLHCKHRGKLQCFCWRCKVSICDSMLWLFAEVTWIHCREVSYTVVPLYHCATLWSPHFSACNWLLGHVLRLPSSFSLALSVTTGIMQRSLLHVCNTVCRVEHSYKRSIMATLPSWNSL